MCRCTAGSMPDATGQRDRGRRRQVGAVAGHVVEAHAERTRERDRQLVGRGRGDLVVERDGVVDGRHVVEAVRPRRTDSQLEVDLRRRASGHRRCAHATTLGLLRRYVAPPGGRSPSRRGPRRGSAGRCRRPAAPPRRRPASPPSPSAARSVLRRWANAASTTANTSARLAVVAGGSRRVMATSPQSTLGAGQNTARPIAPARFTSAYHALLTDGTPYVRLPGRRGQPVGDLRLHHHQHPPQRLEALEHRQQHRHRDVVGQVGDQRGRRRARQVLQPQRVGRDDGQPRRRTPVRARRRCPAARRPAPGRSRRRPPTRPRAAGRGSATRAPARPRRRRRRARHRPRARCGARCWRR